VLAVEPPLQEELSAPRMLMLVPRAGHTPMLWGPSAQISFHLVHEPAFKRLIAKKKKVLLPLFCLE